MEVIIWLVQASAGLVAENQGCKNLDDGQSFQDFKKYARPKRKRSQTIEDSSNDLSCVSGMYLSNDLSNGFFSAAKVGFISTYAR